MAEHYHKDGTKMGWTHNQEGKRSLDVLKISLGQRMEAIK